MIVTDSQFKVGTLVHLEGWGEREWEVTGTELVFTLEANNGDFKTHITEDQLTMIEAKHTHILGDAYCPKCGERL